MSAHQIIRGSEAVIRMEQDVAIRQGRRSGGIVLLVADECSTGNGLSEFFSVFIIHPAGIPKDLCVQVGTILNLGAIDIANKSANGAKERETFPERLVIRYIGLVIIIEGTDRTMGTEDLLHS